MYFFNLVFKSHKSYVIIHYLRIIIQRTLIFRSVWCRT